jgi:tetratricopeptide (TPR) repeat protein|uniref:hypothetical protein ycf37 n=1 Tax=Cryptomonas gyropyrenoidosa TaxID=233257 RepID=UPI00279806D8|nr:hypothetical protein ycf37 [Cryptomonas gyropyrenoidosa]WFQ82946.1 hypothetical protein ycf37 [Cryptomonas gyropyrenoidosa]
MKTLLPILYLSILFLFLTILVFFLTQEIKEKRKLEEKFISLKKKIQFNSSSVNTIDHYLLGKAYLSKKLFDQSIIQFSQALKKWKPEDSIELAFLYNAIGFTYFQSNQIDMAIQYYREALSSNPTYTTALTNLAFCYERKKMIKDAIKIYKNVLNYDPINEVAVQKLEYLSKKSKISG